MTKAQMMWMAGLVLAACSWALAAEPEVWIPAQQAPETKTGQAPSGQSGQPAAGQQPSTAPSEEPRVDQPMQPIAPLDADSSSKQKDAGTTPAMVPDSTPLNSPQDLTLGSEGGATRNTFAPSFRFSQFADITTSALGTNTTAVTTLVGSGVLQHSWSRALLTLNYSAGGTIFPSDSDRNATFQTFGVASRFQLQRWTLSVNDSGSYLPESSFGYYAATGQLGGSVGSGYIPNQTILTDSPRISNTVAVTLQRPLTARSSVHFSGSYGILRFQNRGVSSGLINSDDILFGGGYDHNFGAHNTIGIGYSGSIDTFGGTDRSITTHGANLSFARRLTGRLALQLSGGPQVRIVEDPVFGSDTAATWNVRSTLMYATRELNLSTTFTRRTTAGGGLTSGTETYEWQGNVGRQLGRVWSVSGGFGYARNTTLAQSLFPDRHFNTVFTNAQVTRPLGREMSLFFSYNFQHQTSDFPICLGCSDSFNRHVVGVGFEWHKRPFVLGF